MAVGHPSAMPADRHVEVTPTPTQSWASFARRPALDGLRAIAALLVVVFHAGMPGVRNGFVGVDVFFVLSGFLITSLIVRERLSRGRFSFANFYSRRVRRLLPAALLVLVVTAVLYEALAAPLAVAENRSSFMWAAAYVSNWYFLAQSQDYFAADASPSPVLHYWSLSVEEQFYFVWPLVVIGLLMVPVIRRRLSVPTVALLAVAAVIVSGLVARANPIESYFNTVTRSYQLLLGATLAVVILQVERVRERRGRTSAVSGRRRVLGDVIAGIGIAALVLVATDLGPVSPWWTGLWGSLATVAALVGLEISPRGRLSWSLTRSVPAHLGRWSYSIYLWHWPVIVLGGLAVLLPESWLPRVVVVVGASVALAAASWYAMEAPIQRMRLSTLRLKRVSIAAGGFATAATVLVTALVLSVPANVQQLYAQISESGATDVGSGEELEILAAGSQSQEAPKVLLIGDSHARQWWLGLSTYGAQAGWNVRMVQKSACPWMKVDAIDPNGGGLLPCDTELREPALREAEEFQPDVVILAARSILVRQLSTPRGVLDPQGPQWRSVVESGMTKFLDRLSPYAGQVVLLDPIPETRTSMNNCLSYGRDPKDCAQPAVFQPGTQDIGELNRTAARRPQTFFVSANDLLCPKGICPAMVNGMATHRDTHHLTLDYAETVWPSLISRMQKKGVDFVARAGATASSATSASGGLVADSPS